LSLPVFRPPDGAARFGRHCGGGQAGLDILPDLFWTVERWKLASNLLVELRKIANSPNFDLN
jgi:hypothetical protein